jgi:hypothetical protein
MSGWDEISGSLNRASETAAKHQETANAVLHFETKSSGMIEQCIIKTIDGRLIPVIADVKTRTVWPSRNKTSQGRT